MAQENDVSMIPDAKLLERAVRSARSNRYPKRRAHSRWIAVMDMFALGSTFAHQLCRRYGADPDEMVRR